MRIQIEDTLAIMIDYQEKLVPVMKNKEQLIKNTKILTEGLKVLGVPLLVSQQYTKGLGMTIKELVDIIDDFHYYEKLEFSCYQEKTIMKYIKESNKKNILLYGIEAHICVMQTAIDLLEGNFNVILVEDCIGSRKDNDKQVAFRRLERDGAIVTTYESILFELTKVASNTNFKRISSLIK